MNRLLRVPQLLQVSKRTLADGPPASLLRKYEKFQRDDGVPVYKKGGAGDTILIGFTLVMIAYGLADGFWTLTHLGGKKK